ncbi:hypothetical protein D3C85_781250 [compost metagenome]
MAGGLGVEGVNGSVEEVVQLCPQIGWARLSVIGIDHVGKAGVEPRLCAGRACASGV